MSSIEDDLRAQQQALASLAASLAACAADTGAIAARVEAALAQTPPAPPPVRTPGPGFFGDEAEAPWYEFGAAADGSLRVAYNDWDGKITLRKNVAGGAGDASSWLKTGQYDFNTNGFGSAPLSLLADGSMAMVVASITPAPHATVSVGWLRAPPGSDVFAGYTPIPVPAGALPYGPLLQLEVRPATAPKTYRYAFNHYSQIAGQPNLSHIMWSDDGDIWPATDTLPYPADGNLGLTEATVGEFPSAAYPYAFAVRADLDAANPAKRDGGYLGLKIAGGWSAPGNTGRRIRMPRVIRHPGGAFMLSLREYVPSTGKQLGLVLIDPGDGFGPPIVVTDDANNAPFVFCHQGQWWALVQHCAPNQRSFSRIALTIPA